MTTWTAASFLGGHPALDFVNTVADRTKGRTVELLSEFVDAVDWAHAARVLDSDERDDLRARAERAGTEASAALAELRTQREALHAFLLAGIENTDCDPAVRGQVKADVAAAYRDAHLSDRFRTGPAWVIDPGEAGLHVLARRIALAGAELLTSEQRSQIGVCGRCSWLFLDPSPSRRRRWCSMATCGNRAKAERHQRR